MEKNSYERRAYGSVDDGSPSWVTSQKSTNNKIQAVNGQLIRVNFVLLFKKENNYWPFLV